MTESEIQKDIMVTLTKIGAFVIRNHTQSIKYSRGTGTNPNRGMPDLTAIRNGVTVWIEVKKPGGKLNKYQMAWHANARNHGAVVVTATSVDEIVSLFCDQKI